MTIGRIPSVEGGIQPTIVDAKGDLIAGVAADSVNRLAVGANGTVLTADSAETTGLKWVAPAGGGANWSLLNAGGTALTGAQTITVSGISGKDKLMVLVAGASSANVSSFIQVRFNTDTASNYYVYGATVSAPSTYAASFVQQENDAYGAISLGRMSANAGSIVSGYCLISGANASGVKIYNAAGTGSASTSNTQIFYSVGGYYDSASTISSVSLFSNSGNFDAGTVYIYASA